MAETLTIDTTPETEVVGELSAEEQDSLEVGEKLAAEEASLLAGKFKDAEELEKAYIELQGKLGAPKEEKEDTSQELEIEKESKEDEEVKEADPDFLDRLWEEAQSEYTDATMQELSKMDPKELAQMHLQYRSENQKGVTEKEVSQLKTVAGGDKQYTEMLDWAQGNLQKEEIDMYDQVMETGDASACFFAIQALKYRFDDASGVEGKMLTGKAPSTKGDQFKSQAQVIEAMNDPRYETDPAFRKEVADKLERSDVQF
tara:strand:- start:183 stop:956 length:774 start_codon:yes stop_codon:yes gene_type:complete